MNRYLKITIVLFILINSLTYGQTGHPSGYYDGKFCAGKGDVDFLRLIDESFAFLGPNPVVPNLSMLYQPDWDAFEEGAGWGGWWIQNSYGFSYAATPFLQEPWFSLLQRSLDFHWDGQGDGKRASFWDGHPVAPHLIAPDGVLGDMARPGEMWYKQGDGDLNVHDWFYEATAAGVVMQAEILLASRNMEAILHYLPKMERACNAIERTRDPGNNLFLVGPACNLLAPSYGGVKQPDGSFGKGYLTGVSITYLAALDRMVELFKLTGKLDKLSIYEQRQKITRESLPRLMAKEGYFVKSLEVEGVKHGVLGQEQFGYLEGVANADAVALRVADDKTAARIYDQIAAYPAIRPFDFLLTNAPGLDDTYWNYGNTTGKGMDDIHEFGCWVNGGAWGTVEGRAILMYYRLGKFEDIRRSASRAMKWAKDFRMDAPFTQRGENSNNNWTEKGRRFYGKGAAVMVDNFAVPAATVRGLFDFEYHFDRLILRPRIPGTITQYRQKQPVRFGEKEIYISCVNGGPKVKSVKVNGKNMKMSLHDRVELLFENLPVNAQVEITTTGGWSKGDTKPDYPVLPALVSAPEIEKADQGELPESLRRPYEVLQRMKKLLEDKEEIAFDRAFIEAAIQSIEACRERAALNPGPGYFRDMTPERRNGVREFYEQTALSMYKGIVNRMEQYEGKGDMKQKEIALMFKKVSSAGNL